MERVIQRTRQLLPVRIISYCLMPNQWHLVLWPQADGQLSQFMRLLTVTHTQRWHALYHTAGQWPCISLAKRELEPPSALTFDNLTVIMARRVGC